MQPKTCSICPEKYYAKDFCSKHYLRWKKHGDPYQVAKNPLHDNAYITGVRVCKKCKRSKPIDEFPLRFDGPEVTKRYRRGACVDCRNIGRNAYTAQTRVEVLRHYCGGKTPSCACCDERKIEFLGLDHINGGGNKHRKMLNLRSLHFHLKSRGYPEGFRVLCHNCNFSMGHYGYCPHGNLNIKGAI